MEYTTSSDNYTSLVKRIAGARAALHSAVDPAAREILLDELGAATRDLAELVLQKEGRLKSPLE